MRSPLSGPIATLLMFVPLVAIPLLAVFGMPKFSTLAPDSQVEDLKFAVDRDKPSSKAAERQADLVDEIQVTESNAAPGTVESNRDKPQGESDPFAEFVRPAAGDSPHADSPSSDRKSSPPRRPQHWPPEEPRNTPQEPVATPDKASLDGGTTASDREPASPDGANTMAPEKRRSKAATRLTGAFDANRRPDFDRAGLNVAGSPSAHAQAWKAAIARLNALGIHEYQIQPGEREGEIEFRCLYVLRNNNPRVMQRFEAEAREPLEAVEQVLAQIDDWKARQAAADAHSSTRKSPPKVTALSPGDEAVPMPSIDVSNR
jgi:hypothetical protein